MRAFLGGQLSWRWGTWALPLALGLGLAVSPACRAADWTGDFHLENDVKYDDNILVETKPKGWVVGDVVKPRVTFAQKTTTRSVSFNLGAQAEKYSGPGKTSGLDTFDLDLGFNGEKAWSRSTLSAYATFQQQPTRTSELEASGLTSQSATRKTTRAGTALDVKVTTRDSFKLSAGATDVTFTGSSQAFTPYRSYDLDGTISRALTPTDDVGVTLGMTMFRPEGTNSTGNTTTYRLTAHHTMRRSENWTLRGAAGVNLVRRDTQSNANVKASSYGFRLDSGVTYRAGPDTLTLDLNQDVAPGSEGNVQQNRAVRLDVTHAVNSRVNLRLNAAYFSVLPNVEFFGIGKSQRDVVTVEPSISWKILPRVSLSFRYRYIYEDTLDQGVAKGNSIFATISVDQNLFR